VTYKYITQKEQGMGRTKSIVVGFRVTRTKYIKKAGRIL
jgi:hypothetical protein